MMMHMVLQTTVAIAAKDYHLMKSTVKAVELEQLL